MHNWRWSLEECFVHVCKELEGIAASAEALDDERHVSDAFFLLLFCCDILIALRGASPVHTTPLRKNSTVGQST